MIQFIPIILICTLNIPKQDCRKTNSQVSVVRAEAQPNMMSCLMAGQIFIAQKAYAPSDEHPSYVIVRCEPQEF